MNMMKLKNWVAPIALAIFSMLVSGYLLLGSAPKNNSVDANANVLDADLLQYFTVQAENYAKEGAEKPQVQSFKKVDPI